MQRFLTLAVLLCTSAPLAAQSTWYVDLNATPPGDGSQVSPFVSIQQALAEATTVHGDTILVAPGDYHESLDFLEKSLTVRASAGPLATTLRPTDPADPIVVTIGEGLQTRPAAVLEGFTILRDSSAPGQVGVRSSAQGRLVRCIVTGHAIGVSNVYDAFLDECTVSGNDVGMRDAQSGVHRLRNTICRGNGVDMQVFISGGVTLEYTDVGGLSELPCGQIGPCTGSFDADPLFWDAAGGDFHLRAGSPCIDAGDPDDPLDPDGTRIDVGALTYDPFWAPGTESSCFGDALACPCGNGGSGAGGCDNFQATGGFVLQVMSFAPSGAGGGTAQFLGTGYPPAATPGSTLIRSPMLEVPPVVFGDGLRCIATAGLVRVGATVALGGTSLHAINHSAGAGTFHYQVWVRSNPATFCNPQAFNLSNAVSVTW